MVELIGIGPTTSPSSLFKEKSLCGGAEGKFKGGSIFFTYLLAKQRIKNL
jgi:hypothetical protein